MTVALKIENVGKLYRLGTVGTGSLVHDMNRWWHRIRKKEDPYLKIGDENDRSSKGTSEYVWALKHISFEVKQGDVLGIIGKNGAGKSTLLKILSRVTGPTTGVISGKGRIASLLEVGTGFHPELTGRENIYLNGAILGMTKAEVTSKFDQIVDFSGVERYIDTPVKRYSSGMYVRLAFAVAAHLEPEILIIDEVLAVGDAEFQKKCLGKMKDVAGEGRTVLFVSHNMQAVRGLCDSCILLANGMMAASGRTEDVIDKYLNQFVKAEFKLEWKRDEQKEYPASDLIIVEGVKIRAASGKVITVAEQVLVDVEYSINVPDLNLDIEIWFFTSKEEPIFSLHPGSTKHEKGDYRMTFKVPANFLNDGVHLLTLQVIKEQELPHIIILPNILTFDVSDTETRDMNYFGKWPGMIRPDFLKKEITITKI